MSILFAHGGDSLFLFLIFFFLTFNVVCYLVHCVYRKNDSADNYEDTEHTLAHISKVADKTAYVKFAEYIHNKTSVYPYLSEEAQYKSARDNRGYLT